MKKKKEDYAYRSFVTNHTTNILKAVSLDDYLLFVNSLENEDKNGEQPPTATMDVDYEYLTAHLKCDDSWFKEKFEAKEYHRMLNVLCHECAHIITSELPDMVGLDYRGDMKFYLERMTERVGRLIHRIYIQYMEVNKIKIETGK